MIPYGRQTIHQQDIDAVIEVLQSDFLTQGPTVPRFEQALAVHCQAAHAVAVNSGTSALHLACLALGLGPGDWLWTSPISFVASANCALYCGAQVDFVDICPHTGNLSAEDLEQKLRKACAEQRLPKVLVVVHYAGLPCDLVAISALAKRYGVHIIEDACHALGAHYQNRPIGCGQYSDITVFSFHPVKVITSAEGGMALTNNPVLARSMALLRSHGITREPCEFNHPSDGPWYYEQQQLGFNYRMSDLQAALGLSQLNQLPAWITRRQQIAHYYFSELAPHLLPHHFNDNLQGAFHLYVQHVPAPQRLAYFKQLRAQNIGVNVHYIPIYRHPFYASKNFLPLPHAEAFYESALTLPLYPSLLDEQVESIVQRVKNLSPHS